MIIQFPSFRIISVFLLLIIVVSLFGASAAAQTIMSRTYTFTSSSALNYEITGQVSLDEGARPGWYNSDWQYRQRITIHKEWIGESLTDFPILIRLDETSVYEHARADAHDLLFTASDGITKLAHEVESPTAIWVKIPKLKPTDDTDIFVYYGNSYVIVDQQQPEDVWTNGYAGVWHMNKDPADRVYDSSRNDNDGTGVEGMDANESLEVGKIDQSVRFIRGGRQDKITIPHSESLDNLDQVTLSVWLKPTTSNSYKVLHKGCGSYELYYFASEAGFAGCRWSGGNVTWVTQNDILTQGYLGKWQYVAATYNYSSTNNDAAIYYDGQLQTTSNPTPSGTLLNEAEDLIIGNWAAGTREFDGLVDEVRVSNVVRSSAWIRAEHANQSGDEAFLTISSDIETHPSTSSGSAQIAMKPDRPLSFTTLTSFRPNASDQVTYQLSNDGGKTWLFYYGGTTSSRAGWKGANPSNPTHRSSANDISGHLNTFPQGEGKLLWRAYLPSGTSLDSIQIGYVPGTSTSVALPVTPSGLLPQLNTLFRSAFKREPTASDWTHWATRMLSETKPLDAWLGAMEWQALFSS